MVLTGPQFQLLHKALLSAFPSAANLSIMVRFGLNENLDTIATGNLSAVVFQLITWADSQGRLQELVTEAQKANPGNPDLAAFHLSPAQSASSAPGNPASPTAGRIDIGGNVTGSVLITGNNNTVHTAQNSPNSPPAVPSAGHQPITLFYSYSHKDEKLREKLETHLALLKHQGVIADWHDRKISAGTEWANRIDANLNTAQVILLLVSADFLASDYCYDVELKRAMERHEAGEARIIPVILRPCDWHSASFGALLALPKDGKPVVEWSNRDAAFTNIVTGIRSVVTTLLPAKSG